MIAMGEDSKRIRICGAKSRVSIADLEGHTNGVELQFAVQLIL